MTAPLETDSALAVPATPGELEALLDLSVIIPAYNEAENLAVVVPRACKTLEELTDRYEILVIDDGSTDGTLETLEELQGRLPQVHPIRLRRNHGKSAALQAGFDRARGRRIVLMDADGQDLPEEIPRLLEALDSGLDLATGRRTTRNDRFIKRHTSRVYNVVTATVTGVKGEDFNSGLKAMRREVMLPLVVYGELHRYIPVLAQWNGFKVGEVGVVHAARLHGRSKFGRARFLRGFLDLITVKFLTTYTARPLHLFGGLGVAFGGIGAALLAWMFVLKVTGHGIGDRPALQIGILFVVVAVQLITLGLLAELMVHLRRDRRVDVVADRDPGA